MEDDSARVVEQMGDALLLKASGPTIRDTQFWDAEDEIHLTWYMVQDSSLGVVFRKPSGLKRNGEYYDGDIDLLALEPIRVIEVKSLVFSIWKEFAGTKIATRYRNLALDDETDMDPGWADPYNQLSTHAISVTYISRVRKPDGSIVVADSSFALEVAQSIDEGVTYQQLQPEAEDQEDSEGGGS